ncbi:hypothetical protein BY458DRAFT_525494 [Sporodiniella umbellata]|nr:hypothetical protein BY458DRAFT_525494 [Sporodiniella umbellata]
MLVARLGFFPLLVNALSKYKATRLQKIYVLSIFKGPSGTLDLVFTPILYTRPSYKHATILYFQIYAVAING